VSAQGQYAGQYFGDYFGQAGTPVVPGVMVGTAHISFSAVGELTAVYPVVPGVMVGTAHISFAATGLLTDGQAPASAPARPSYWSDRPWRDVPFIPITPRRPRRRRQDDLIFLGR
jgi:hypothetical protein